MASQVIGHRRTERYQLDNPTLGLGLEFVQLDVRFNEFRCRSVVAFDKGAHRFLDGGFRECSHRDDQCAQIGKILVECFQRMSVRLLHGSAPQPNRPVM
jgi:hypothetical protein